MRLGDAGGPAQDSLRGDVPLRLPREQLWTVEYKIWRGLGGKLEYRHDQASRNAFSLEDFSTRPTSRSQDTFSVALQYSFF